MSVSGLFVVADHQGVGFLRGMGGALAAIALPNVAIILLGLMVFMNRPLLNVDYFIIVVLVFMGKVLAARILLPIIVVVDIVFSLAPAWHFQPGSAIRSIMDLMHLQGVFVGAAILVVILVAVLISELLIRILRHEWGGVKAKKRWEFLACLGVVFMGVVGADLVAQDSRSPSFLEEINIAGSGLNGLRVALTAPGWVEDMRSLSGGAIFPYIQDWLIMGKIRIFLEMLF